MFYLAIPVGSALGYLIGGFVEARWGWRTAFFVAGGPGLVQYGPDQSCAQQVATKIKVTKSIQVVGTRVSECKLASAKNAVLFCQSGAMGEWNIDYISGKIGKTVNGPGYGCNVNFSTSSIGNAVCR